MNEKHTAVPITSTRNVPDNLLTGADHQGCVDGSSWEGSKMRRRKRSSRQLRQSPRRSGLRFRRRLPPASDPLFPPRPPKHFEGDGSWIGGSSAGGDVCCYMFTV